MKFLRVAGLHYSYAKKKPYEKNKELSSSTYQVQQDNIFSYLFNYSNSLTNHLRTIGYDASEILYDVEPLQKMWAKENGCVFSESKWQPEILIQQIKKIKPEILYLHNATAIPLEILKQRDEIFPFLKCLVMFRGYPEIDRSLFEVLSCSDLLLVGSPVLEKICRNNGLKSVIFHHYFDDRILPLTHVEQNCQLSFVGTSGFGYGWNHQPRYQYLLELLKNTQIQCWLEESQYPKGAWKDGVKRFCELILSNLPQRSLEYLNEHQGLPSMFRKLAFNSLARKSGIKQGTSIFPDEPLSRIFPNKCNGPVFGLEMYKVLASSKITFNKHTFAALGTVDNIRLFEATGTGTCLLTDAGSNLSSLFEVDREVVTYSSIDECLEKIEYLLRNEPVRKRIAENGQKRTLKDHTASCRAMQLNKIIQGKIG